MKLIILIDERLKNQEQKLLDAHMSTFEIKKEDCNKHFTDLPDVDCYIVSSSSHWWDWNVLACKEKKTASVYYSKGKLDQPFKLHTDYVITRFPTCLLYTSPSPRDVEESRMPSSA